jgi:hypothetical protein
MPIKDDVAVGLLDNNVQVQRLRKVIDGTLIRIIEPRTSEINMLDFAQWIHGVCPTGDTVPCLNEDTGQSSFLCFLGCF